MEWCKELKIDNESKFWFISNYHLKVASASPAFHPTIKNVVSEVSRIFSCVPDAVGKTIGNGDLKSEFVQFKQEFDTVREHDIPKCAELESINQKYRFE